MNWRTWALGILHAAIGGAANSAAAMFVEPEHFNLGEGIGRVGAMAAAGALIGVVMYLRASPLPKGWDGVDRRNGGTGEN